jgi:uncharacterized protein YbbC (DUF1343 family)
MLAGLDVLVFDLQDIGARFYTYITTLALCLEAAKENGKAVIVLDRPNAIGGEIVEGPILEKKFCGGFSGYFPIPTRHAMTMGELARLFNDEFKIGASLEIVRMENWRRGQHLDESGLPWVNPSPNMRSIEAAISYSGLGALEDTNLSVGRGTAKPFLWYGAPWMDSKAASQALNARGLAGLRFDPVSFTPAVWPRLPLYPYTGQQCHGFEIVLTDRASFRPVTVVLHIIDALRHLYPKRFAYSQAFRMIGRSDIGYMLETGKSPGEIIKSWEPELAAFLRVRERYLLYR